MNSSFTQTSDSLYDRHHYKVVYKNRKPVIVDNYADVHSLWAKTNPEYIEVLDIANKKRSGGGF